MRIVLKIALLVALASLPASCANISNVESNVDKINYVRESKKENCDIKFFNGTKPQVAYDAIGKIESHIQKNKLFGGGASLETEGYEELRIKACDVGGDAVIIDDSIQTSVSEMTHVHIWATVIKYRTDASPNGVAEPQPR